MIIDLRKEEEEDIEIINLIGENDEYSNNNEEKLNNKIKILQKKDSIEAIPEVDEERLRSLGSIVSMSKVLANEESSSKLNPTIIILPKKNLNNETNDNNNEINNNLNEENIDEGKDNANSILNNGFIGNADDENIKEIKLLFKKNLKDNHNKTDNMNQEDKKKETTCLTPNSNGNKFFCFSSKRSKILFNQIIQGKDNLNNRTENRNSIVSTIKEESTLTPKLKIRIVKENETGRTVTNSNLIKIGDISKIFKGPIENKNKIYLPKLDLCLMNSGEEDIKNNINNNGNIATDFNRNTPKYRFNRLKISSNPSSFQGINKELNPNLKSNNKAILNNNSNEKLPLIHSLPLIQNNVFQKKK